MPPRIAQLRRFPLKGAASVTERQLLVNPTVGVMYDRSIALRRRPGDLTKRADKFNKFDYVVCANTAAIAKERPTFVHTSSEYALDPVYLEGLKCRLHDKGELTVQDTRGEYHLADTAGPQVSFINLTTLKALEELMGVEVDPDRFRMNVWIENLPAFAEYDLVEQYPGTREIMVGNVRMRVDDAAERCKAPDASPEKGEYDLNIMAALTQLMEPRGYKSPHRGISTVMGVYGVVLSEGVLKVGDEIQLL